MNAKRKSSRPKSPRAADRLTVRRAGSGGEHELVYPHSVERRADDLNEVRKMLAAEEIDVAEDELRWLVGGCPLLLEAHKLLGRIAAGDDDWELARGHFGYAYELGMTAAKGVRPPGTFPYALAGNRDLHEAGRGLIESLVNLNEPDLARQVTAQLLAWDPSDPLGVKGLADLRIL